MRASHEEKRNGGVLQRLLQCAVGGFTPAALESPVLSAICCQRTAVTGE